jgi:hypothetical protein
MSAFLFKGVSRETGEGVKQLGFLHERIKMLFSQKKGFRDESHGIT